jgi:hypothetical protein
MLQDTNKRLQEYNASESSIVVPYRPNSFKLDMNCVAFI